MDRKEFVSKIKAKYPDYANVDDTVLFSKMKEKYPEYKDSVSDWDDKTPQQTDFDSQVAEAKREANPITGFIRGAIAGGSSNTQNLNTERQPGLFGKSVPSMKAIYRAEQEESPNAYGTGEFVGSMFLDPVSKVTAPLKYGKKLMVPLMAALNATQGGINAYNTDGDVTSAAITSGGLGSLSPLFKGSIKGTRNLFDKIGTDAKLKGLDLVTVTQAKNLGMDAKDIKRLSNAVPTSYTWLDSKTRADKIQGLIDPLNRQVNDALEAGTAREIATKTQMGVNPERVKDSIIDYSKKAGIMAPRDVADLQGNLSRVSVPTNLQASQSDSAFGKLLNDLEALRPHKTVQTGISQPQATDKLGNLLPSSPIYGTIPDQGKNLNLEATVLTKRNLQSNTDWNMSDTATTSKYKRASAGLFGNEMAAQSLRNPTPELSQIVKAQRKISPLMTAKNLAEQGANRDYQKNVMGLTPLESMGVAGAPYSFLPLVLARRFGNAAIASTSLGAIAPTFDKADDVSKFLSKNQVTKKILDNSSTMAPLRYFSSKGNE